MDAIDSLPVKSYLSAYDLNTKELADRDWVDYVVNGAALAELLRGGFVTVSGDRLNRVDGRRPADFVLSQALADFDPENHESWKDALRHGTRTLGAVQQELQRLGLLPSGDGWAPVDPASFEKIQIQLRAFFVDRTDPSTLRPIDAALVALVAVVPFKTVVPRGMKPSERVVEWLTRRGSEEIPAFDQLIRQMRHTRAQAFTTTGPIR